MYNCAIYLSCIFTPHYSGVLNSSVVLLLQWSTFILPPETYRQLNFKQFPELINKTEMPSLLA